MPIIQCKYNHQKKNERKKRKKNHRKRDKINESKNCRSHEKTQMVNNSIQLFESQKNKNKNTENRQQNSKHSLI